MARLNPIGYFYSEYRMETGKNLELILYFCWVSFMYIEKTFQQQRTGIVFHFGWT